MTDVNVKWIEGEQFEAADQAGHSVITGAAGAFKAGELLLAALGGCSGVDVVRILQKKRQKIVSVEANLRKHNAADPPWTIERIEVEWVVRGHNLSEKAVRDAVHLAETGYCSVAASLKSEIVSTVRLIEDSGTGS